MIKQLTCLLVTILLLCSCAKIHADTDQTFLVWNNFLATGDFNGNKDLKYYLETNLRYAIDDKVFDQQINRIAFGHSVTPNLTWYAGIAYIVSHSHSSGNYHNEFRTWEQVSWQFYKSKLYEVSSRSRLEQRTRQDDNAIAWRYRQLIEISFLKLINSKTDLVCNDEIFLNLNTPRWTSNKTLEQNRAFLGVRFPLSSRTNLTLGYLNQYIMGREENRMNHILNVSFGFK